MMYKLSRAGKIAWLALLAIALCTLTAGAGEKTIDFGGDVPKVEPKVEVKAEPKVEPKVEVEAEDPAPKVSEAEAMIDQYIKEETARQDRDRFFAEHYTRSGIERFKEMDYEAAREDLAKAIKLNAKNQEAKEYLRKAEAVLGLRQRPMIDEEGVRVSLDRQIALQEVKVNFDKGRRLVEAGEFDQAVHTLERVRELAKYIAPYTNVEPWASQTEEYIKKAAAEKANRKILQEQAERDKAVAVARLNEIERKERYEQRIGRLLNRGRDFLNQGRYDEARKLALDIIELDPMNIEAKKLADVAFDAGLANMVRTTAKSTGQETLLTWAEVQEARVPYTPVLIYPNNWEEVMNRKVEAIGTEPEQEDSEATQELRNKLEQKVSFDFIDTSLPDVITFLQTLTNATIVLDSKAIPGEPPQLTLKMNDMKLSQALDWIMTQVGLDYTLRSNAIYISTSEMIGGDAVLKLYDVTDVTLVIRDFKGDLTALRERIGTVDSAGGGGDAGGWGAMADDAGADDTTFSPEALVELIKKTIAPGTWDE
ncbi:MAG TPA: hypothetical protein VM141_05720 [Planctomycetota bacterium]|nr:hypothetical protein [Planctomycetota bacterium]